MTTEKDKIIEEIESAIVSPFMEWKLVIDADVDKTGNGDCGLFVEAKTEKEAKKYIKSLIEIIKKNKIKW